MKQKDIKIKETSKIDMKKSLILIFTLILLLAPIYALDNQFTAKQGDCYNIFQVCSSCSYVNISSVSNQNNSNLVSNVEMIYFGNGEWRYEFCDTIFIGRYDVKGQGDINGVDDNFAIYFEVTPSGNNGSNNIVFYILVLVFLYTINLLGFFKKNAPVTILGGIGLTLLGLYMIKNGIIIYRNNLTLTISYITLFWGLGSSLWATIETIQDNL